MASVFINTLSPMLMMFACMIIGFVLNKKKLCPDNTASVLSKLEANVFAPALIINSFSKYCTINSLSNQYSLILYCLLILAIAICIAYALSPVFTKKGYSRNVYRYALTFGNFGFMGNAIVPAILGNAALYEYMLFTLPLNVIVYTWGIATLIPKSERNQNPLKNLLNPSMFAVIIGMTLGLTGASKYMPSFVESTLSGLGNCMGPVAMLLTGFLIGQYPIQKLLNDKKVYIASFLRLIVLPALFVVILKLLGAENWAITMCLFAFGTPLGLNTVVFPAAYGGDPSTGVSMATISHTACIITIPVMYALLTMLFL